MGEVNSSAMNIDGKADDDDFSASHMSGLGLSLQPFGDGLCLINEESLGSETQSKVILQQVGIFDNHGTHLLPDQAIYMIEENKPAVEENKPAASADVTDYDVEQMMWDNSQDVKNAKETSST